MHQSFESPTHPGHGVEKAGILSPHIHQLVFPWEVG